MKLLPSRELQNKKKSVELEESIRITEVRSELSREERDLELFKENNRLEREKIKMDFDGKLIVLNDELSRLEGEVKKLREERALLLIPLDGIKKKAAENLAESEEMLQSLEKKKKEVNKEKEILEKKNKEAQKQLDTLLEREGYLNERESDISNRDNELKVLEEATVHNSDLFAAQVNKRNIELMNFEDRVNKKEVELAEREKLVAKDKEQIIVDRNHIESQQQTLIAAYAEAKKKQII